MGDQVKSQLPVYQLYKTELLQEEPSQCCHSTVGDRGLCYLLDLVSKLLRLETPGPCSSIGLLVILGCVLFFPQICYSQEKFWSRRIKIPSKRQF